MCVLYIGALWVVALVWYRWTLVNVEEFDDDDNDKRVG